MQITITTVDKKSCSAGVATHSNISSVDSTLIDILYNLPRKPCR